MNDKSSSSIDTKASNKLNLKKLRKQEVLISLACVLGVLVCLYSLKVEIYKARDKDYVAFCDIGPFSCSRVFTSKYGKGFGLLPENHFLSWPNSIYGLLFFTIQLLLLLLRNNVNAMKLKIFLSILANLGNVYLASILYFVLYDFCIVCFSTYVVNGFLLVFNYNHLKYYKLVKETSKKNNKLS